MTRSVELAGARRPGGRPASERRDIQGLRAVAVVAVILSHLCGWPAGGFVGVDVFFVISGFLITGLLLRGIEERGRVQLADFYRRRIKRILPAALLVLAVSTAAAAVVFNTGRFAQVMADAGWAALFAANQHLIAVGTDYFQAGGPVSPFQHYWSLAVEEQFYLAWPWLLLVLVLLLRRTGRREAVLLGGLGVVTVASFGWSLAETVAEPTLAYFSTASRGWELGVGALLAVVRPRLRRLPDAWRPWLSTFGQLVIVLSLFVVPSAPGFPAPAALLPVAGAALVIGAGAGGKARFVPVLTNPVSVRLGDLSYSLYLWHLPVIVLLGAVLQPGTAGYLGVCLALILVLSVASYSLVENPVRRSHLFERRAPRNRAVPPRKRVAALGAVAALAVAVAVAVALGQAGPGRSVAAPAAAQSARPTASPSAAGSPTPTPAHTPSPQSAARLTAQLRAALEVSSWPRLQPDIASVGNAARVPEWTKDGCLQVRRANLSRCTWGAGGSTRTALVIGDSIALSWLPAVRGALEPAGYRVEALTYAQCPAADLAMADWDGSGTFAGRCRSHLAWAEREIARSRPDVVIASSAPSTVWRLKDGAEGGAALAEWRRGQTTLLRRIAPNAGTVAVLDPPPPGKSLQECDTRFSHPSDCSGPVPGYLPPFAAATASATAAAHVTHIRTQGWFCTGGRCPAFVGTTPVFTDGQHLTGAYAKRLAGVLGLALQRAGVPFGPPKG